MKKLVSFTAICFAAFVMVSLFSCTAQTPTAGLKSDIDSLSYAYGVNVTQGLNEYLKNMGIEGSLKDEFIKGFLEGSKLNKNNKKAMAHFEGYMIGKQASVDMFNGLSGNVFGSDSTKSLNKQQFLAGFLAATQNKKLLIPQDAATLYVQTKGEEIHNRANEKLKAANQAFLDDNKTKEGVTVLPSGLQYKVVSEGTGAKPAAIDTVTVKYKGMDINGKEFDSNDKANFPLDKVIAGWTEGMQLMSVGSKYTFYIPYNLAYGEQGRRPNIDPYATLIFDVELLNISKAVPAPAAKTPAPVAKTVAPPTVKK